MNRRRAIASLAASLTCPSLVSAANSGQPAGKKGWAGGDPNLHRLFGAHWYYTWSPKTPPIWVTEFNGWSGPEKANREFLEKSLRFLERNEDLERYAYFNPKKGAPHSLLKADGSISRMGELYRDA